MVRKTIILKESELIFLIENIAIDIQEQGSADQRDLMMAYPNISVQTQLDFTRYEERNAVITQEELFATIGAAADWFYAAFIDCDETIDCIQNGLDAIAIIAAFIPGPGWVVSAVAGLASAGISLSRGDIATGSAMIVFELFPITRIGKRIYKGVKAAKTADVDKIMVKMMDNGFNAKTYKTLKGTDKEIADFVLKNVDGIEADVLKAVKELKNNKAAKDLMKLTNSELMAVAAKTGSDYQNLKIAVQFMKNQAKNIDDYAKFFSTWRVVAREVLFIGGAVTAMVVTQIALSLPKEFYLRILGGGSEEKGRVAIEEILAEEGIEELLDGIPQSPEELINGIFNNEGTKSCMMNAFFVILVEKECSAAFVRDVLDMFRYEHDFEGTNEEVWEAWAEDSIARFEEEESSSGKSAEERWLDTIKWTMEYYIGQESQKACWDGDQLKTELYDCVKSYLTT